jgi:hypothetical protein
VTDNFQSKFSSRKKFWSDADVGHRHVKLRRQSSRFSSFNQQIVAAKPHSTVGLGVSPDADAAARKSMAVRAYPSTT